MSAGSKVFLDACVLANFAVCDLLLRLAEQPQQHRPAWSEAVLEETRRTQVERLGWPERLADSFGRALRRHFPEALVSGYEPLMAELTNDPKDRHVLAAAIHAGAPVLLTFNLKDFPEEALAPWGVEAVHPQAHLLWLYEADAAEVVRRISDVAARRGEGQAEVLRRLAMPLPAFASRLLNDLQNG